MKHLLLLLTALVCFLTASARRDPRYHYEGANSGTYGLSNKRIQCSNCGEFYSAGSQHMCLKHDAGGSSSSSSYPTDGSDVSDGEADALLAEVEKDGLFSTIEQGKFGGVKRPFDGGHGLEGVCTKGENYFNPFIELFMDHE